MRDLLVGQSSLVIVALLFACILLVMEAGFRIGRRSQQVMGDSFKGQVNAIQGAVLGVLALMLGFTFSLALQRYDSRSAAAVDEANAIGTAYLRSQLLPANIRGEAGTLLREYLDLRVRAGGIDLSHNGDREPLLERAATTTEQLWQLALKAAEQDGRPVTSGLFIQSLNDMIDAYGKRDAALNRHVPEVVFFLLFLTFLMAGVIHGYANGIEHNRASFPTVMMVALIVLLVFLIIDLDRPRRGFIQVNQQSMEDLQLSMSSSHARQNPPGKVLGVPKTTRP